MDVSDCHEAVQHILESVDHRHPEKQEEPNLVLFGDGYGGLIATHLAARHPKHYRHLVLQDPQVDLLGLRHLGSLLPNLLGRNYTEGDVEDADLIVDAWERYLQKKQLNPFFKLTTFPFL